MTRQEAIETVRQVMTELDRTPRKTGSELRVDEFIVAVLIALEVLKVEDE